MQAYVSLHTEAPVAQLDSEVHYEGYERIPIEFGDTFGKEEVSINFPALLKESPDVIKYLAIGPAITGDQGEILMRVHVPPYLDCRVGKGLQPKYRIMNPNYVELPANLNPIAREVYKLIYSGLMHQSEMHPKLFEAVNDALLNAGIAPFKVERTADFRMRGKISQIRLSDIGNA